MSDTMNYSDFFDPNLKKQITDLNNHIVSLNKEIAKLGKNKPLKVTNTNDGKELQKQVERIDKIKGTVKEVATLTELKAKAERQTNEVFKQTLLQKTKENKLLEKGKAVLKDKQKLERESAKLARSKTAAGQKEIAKLERIKREQREINKEIKDANNKTNTWGKALNSFPAKFNIIGNVIGGAVLQAVNKIGTGLKAAFGTVVDFEKAMAKVKAISGANNAEFSKLNKLSRELGATTEYTASQIAALNLSLSKLGFNTNQILDMTSSILDLATAIDEDLDESATVVGNTLRGFGLEADQTQRVVDVMAKSFSSSALDLNKFSTSMGKLAPVAKSLGFSVEETTAFLAKLIDAGFDASTAGTSMKNIFLKLADSGSALSKSLGEPVTSAEQLVDGLNRLKSEGIDLGEALELTDQRSVAAFSTFLDGADSVAVMTDSLNNAAGSATEMATIMRDTLSGDIDTLKSAMEGAILDGGTPLNGIFRKIVQTLTFLVRNIDTLLTILGSYVISMKAAAIYTKLFGSAMTTGVSATKRMAVGMRNLGKSFTKFLASNAVGLITTAIVLLGREIYSMITAQTALEKANDTIKDQFIEQTVELDILQKRMLVTKKGTKAYDDQLGELNKQLKAAGLATMTLDSSNKELADSFELLRGQILKNIQIDAYTEVLTDMVKQQLDLEKQMQGYKRTMFTSELEISLYNLQKDALEKIKKEISGITDKVIDLKAVDAPSIFKDFWKHALKTKDALKDAGPTDEQIAAWKKARKEFYEWSKNFEKDSKEAELAIDDLGVAINEVFGGNSVLGKKYKSELTQNLKVYEKYLLDKKTLLGLSVDEEKELQKIQLKNSDVFQQATKEQQDKALALIDKRISKFDDYEQSLRAVFDGVLTDEDISLIEDNILQVTDIFSMFIDAKISKIDELIAKQDEETSEAQEYYDTQKQLSDDGLANDLTNAKKRLDAEKANAKELEKQRKVATENQKKLAKAVLTTNYLAELSNIALYASANIEANAWTGGAYAGLVTAIQTALATGRYVAGLSQINAQKFFGGTDYVQGEAGIDKVPAYLTRGESVNTVSETKQLRAAGVTHSDIPSLVRKGQILESALYSMSDNEDFSLDMLEEQKTTNNILRNTPQNYMKNGSFVESYPHLRKKKTSV